MKSKFRTGKRNIKLLKSLNVKKTFLFIIIILIIASVIFYFFFNKNKKAEENIIPMDSGLKIETLKQGTGEGAKNGDEITVHYTGTLENGTKFDSSLDRNQPFSFVLGIGRVIQGWEQGILGMKVGEKRKLTIPPDLGYGAEGIGPIPPNATLIFEVELLEINK